MSMFSAAHNIVINGGQFTAYSGSTGNGLDAERYPLQTLEQHVAFGAFYNSKERYDAPKCLPRTREAVFREISEWIHVTSIDKPILWLYGPAGAGKSTIAQSVAENAREMKYLLIATFFFWRSDNARSNADRLVPSLVYQILISVPSTREFIVKAIEENPYIFSLNIKEQVEKLIVQPLVSAQDLLLPGASPMVVILDGLDECTDSGKRVNFIQVLTERFQDRSLPLIVLCTSRPESDIRTAFNQIQTSEISTRLVLDNQFEPDADIRTFLKHSFTEIKQNHPLKTHIPDFWPSKEMVEELIRKSSGQFIYSSTVMKQVASKKHHPVRRLEVVLKVGSGLDVSPFKELDALYRLVLSSIEEENRNTLVRIIGMICFQAWSSGDYQRITIPTPTSSVTNLGNGYRTITITPTVIDGVLNLGEGGTLLLLDDLHSLIDVRGPLDPLRPFHASFGDFLEDRSRAGVYYVDAKLTLADHTLAYFKPVLSAITAPCRDYPIIYPPRDHVSICLTVELLEFFKDFPWKYVLDNYVPADPLCLSSEFLSNMGYRFSCPGTSQTAVRSWRDHFNNLYLFCKRASIFSSIWASIYRQLLSELSIWMARNIKSIRVKIGGWSDIEEGYLSIAVRHEYVRRIFAAKLGDYCVDDNFLRMVVDILGTEGLPCRWYIDRMWKNLAIGDTVLDGLVRPSFRFPGCCAWSAHRYGGISCRGCRIGISILLNHSDRTAYLDTLLNHVEKEASKPVMVYTLYGQADAKDNGEEELREAILQYKQKPVLDSYDHSFQLGFDIDSYLEACRHSVTMNCHQLGLPRPPPYRFTIFEQKEPS